MIQRFSFTDPVFPKPGEDLWVLTRLRNITPYDTLEGLMREAWGAACEWHCESAATFHANEWYVAHGMPADQSFTEGPGPYGTAQDNTP